MYMIEKMGNDHRVRLTRNERRALKLLLENSKISDSRIAEILKISSQAVGKIRRKLEHTIIKSYTLDLNYERLGINAFALALAKLTNEGKEKGLGEVEQKLFDDPHVIQVYRVPHGSAQYAILYGFRDISELDFFFHSPNKKREIHNYLENREIFPFSHHSFLKNNPKKLFFKMIDSLGAEIAQEGFKEIEKIKNIPDE